MTGSRQRCKRDALPTELTALSMGYVAGQAFPHRLPHKSGAAPVDSAGVAKVQVPRGLPFRNKINPDAPAVRQLRAFEIVGENPPSVSPVGE